MEAEVRCDCDPQGHKGVQRLMHSVVCVCVDVGGWVLCSISDRCHFQLHLSLFFSSLVCALSDAVCDF